MTTRCFRKERNPDFGNEQTKRDVTNNDVRTPEPARDSHHPDSASFFSPLSSRIMIMLVFSPTPTRQQGATRGGRSTRADSATTQRLGESRRAEKHRGGGWVILHPRRGRWGGIGWLVGLSSPVFRLWTVLRATDTLALSSVSSLSLVQILHRSFIALSLSLFQWLKLYFNLRTTPLFRHAYCRLFRKDQMWNIPSLCEILTENVKTFVAFNVNFRKQAAWILPNLCDAAINLDYSARERGVEYKFDSNIFDKKL